MRVTCTIGLLLIPLTVSAAIAAPPAGGEEIGGASAAWRTSNDGKRLDISGTRSSSEGRSERGSQRHSDARADSDRKGPNRTIGYIPEAPSPFETCLADWDSYRGCWQNSIPGEYTDPEKKADSPGLPPITITDLASFSPAKGTMLGEPDNLGVAGLPTNFVTEAATHVRSGELFGFPIDVRFTPIAYTFSYGDGESTSTSSPGATWRSLGQAQFTPTDTSHTYSKRGTYAAHVSISYTAEIDLGIGWFPIEGRLDIPGPTRQIRIYEARTALVARTCTEQPDAPGC